ncbi:hypothetical protein [Aureibaculum luteum]|uniref:hypothetical protein n=1 Tax=Aureibaculum luteum TaxID=1548456 RepID=UPI000E5101F2|nr:hypothetical protein [Aureibaculum luteum]
MKKLIMILLCSLFINGAFSQEIKEQKEENSKMLDFVSKTGVLIKFEDYNLPNIKAMLYSVVQSRIRKITSGNEEQFFLQISKKGKYDTKTASIAYDDLLEVQKALIKLKSQSELDLNATSDYLENKFVSDDGFRIGYYINKNKLTWTMRLEKYGSDNTVFIKDFETLLETFQSGKEKIEELK